MPRKHFATETDDDRAVLALVAGFWKTAGRAPTLREIADEMKWKAHGSAQRHVAALLAQGTLQRSEATSWKLVVTGQAATGPCIAPVLNTDYAWVPAPAPGLSAYQVERPIADVLPGDLVFIVKDFAVWPGALVLVDAGGDYDLVVYTVDGPNPTAGYGTVRYIQRAITPPD